MGSGIKANDGLERPRYFDRQRLSAEDLRLEQDYLGRRLRRMARFLHGWGVVCGGVVAREAGQGPWHVSLGETYAITPLGDELYIAPALPALDLGERICAACQLPEPGCEETGSVDTQTGIGQLGPAFLIARPRSEPLASAAAYPEDCEHPGNRYEVSRVRETVELDVLCEPPAVTATPECVAVHGAVCEGGIVACPPELGEQDNYVVLARLLINRGGIVTVDVSARRRLLPVELLQRHLVCLCQAPPVTPPPTVTPPPVTTPPPQSTPPPFTITLPPGTTFTVPPEVTFSLPPAATAPPGVTFSIPPETTFSIPPETTFSLPPEATFGPPGGGIPGGPDIGVVTQPVPIDVGLINAVDTRTFDVERGRDTGIETLVLLSNADKTALKQAGIDNVLELYAADTQFLKGTLGISDVKAAEYKANALASVRRAKPIGLDAGTFDLKKGEVMPVEEVASIGAVRGQALRASGMASVVDVANAQPAELAGMLGVSEAHAQGMIEDAQGQIRILT